jgi:hypothetical protein
VKAALMRHYERPLELVDLPDPEPRRADEIVGALRDGEVTGRAVLVP